MYEMQVIYVKLFWERELIWFVSSEPFVYRRDIICPRSVVSWRVDLIAFNDDHDGSQYPRKKSQLCVFPVETSLLRDK